MAELVAALPRIIIDLLSFTLIHAIYIGKGASVQSTAGSRGVRVSGSNAGYTMFRGSV